MRDYSTLVEEKRRLAGVLLHPTSLPSGVLDRDVFRWLDLMHDAGLSVWQFLPLGVPQQNLSPYQCYSAFAMNPALLPEADYTSANMHSQHFTDWYEHERVWLDDYALFMALKSHFKQLSWSEWPDQYKHRNSKALNDFKLHHRAEVEAVYWQQYCLYRRWGEVSEYAHERQILLFGDMPIFVAHDSADVWVHQQSFLLDEKGEATVVTGVPPDYFSETGQRWGNPHYDWDYMLENDFRWWLDRLQNHLRLFDLVRIDHFRGLEAVWVIDAACETAVDGQWKKTPGDKLLLHLQKDMGNIPIVAEDLGIITPEVENLRTAFGLPGMSVLQFSFDAFEDNPHKPQNITYDRVVYTGTHDNDTTVGWFKSLDPQTQTYVMDTLGIDDPGVVADALIETAFASAGQIAIAPLQDFMGLGSEARMNVPGVSENNWTWRFEWRQIPADLTARLRTKVKETGRLQTSQAEKINNGVK